MEHTHFVSVAGLVRNSLGQILLVNSPRRGWEYPGGMVEPGESLQDALHREILEESGVTVRITGFFGVSKNIQKDIVNLDFLCEYVSGTLRTSAESTEVAWFSPEDALEAATFPLTRHRLANMLAAAGEMYCLGFRRDPFQVTDELFLPIAK